MNESMAPDTELTIACVQMEPMVGQKDRNVASSLRHLDAAADRGAGIVVLPELCNSGYLFRDTQEAFELSESIPDGPTVKAWTAVAARRSLHIVAGINERDGDLLYNSAVVIGPSGYIGTFRKIHLWDKENSFFQPGNLGFPIFDTKIGRLGACICYDAWFPEAFRSCAALGADLICLPTNWVPIPGQREGREAMANVLVMAAAHCNSVFIAAADRVGVERGQPFIGQSLIASYTGWPIGGPASADREEIITATVNLSDAKRHRKWNENNEVLKDRRPEMYGRELTR